MTTPVYDSPFMRLTALRVEQPIGSFFAVVLPARVLLELSFTKAVSAIRDPATGSYVVDGSQRLPDPRRLGVIADYIDQIDATFPNSIIIAANFRKDEIRVEGDVDTDIEDEPDEDQLQAEYAKRWKIEVTEVVDADGVQTGESYQLVIPTPDRLAMVIDGQHRLFAFAEAEPDRLDVELLCAVFIDLPPPMQATIFATINSTQKPVDKSLTYELFGYNVANEPEDAWSPEKLAVFLARRLATDKESKMAGRIAVAPVNDFASAKSIPKGEMKISFATIVGGIVRLISSNPRKDANTLKRAFFARRSALESAKRNGPPLRDLYKNKDDATIYAATRNFVNAAWELFWKDAPANSFIRKTVGVQALFDIFREIAGPMFANGAGDMTQAAFEARLRPASHVDFANIRFQNASGSNRTAIRRIIRVNLGLLSADTLPDIDKPFVGTETSGAA